MTYPRILSAFRTPALFFLLAGCSRTPSEVPARASADWIRNAVVLEVSVRSFSPEGNFISLTNSVESFRNFGVSVLLLKPIHPIGDLNRVGLLGSPNAAQDFYGVNPEFGSREDLRALIDTVHKFGMKILLDIPAGQAAWDSKLMFEHPEWFLKDDAGAILSPDARSTDVAALNYNHHELRKYMIAVMEYWVREFGIDGYRFVGTGRIPTDFWEVVRSRLEAIKPVMMISEVAEPEYHVEGFDATVAWSSLNVMRDILGGVSRASRLAEILADEQCQFPKGSIRLRIPDLPDNALRDSEASFRSKEEELLVAACSFLIPGIPLIVQDDVGAGLVSLNRRSSAASLYKRLITMRAELPAVSRGEYTHLGNSREDVVTSFERTLGGNRVIVLINWSRVPTSVSVDPHGSETSWREYLDGEMFGGGGAIEVRLTPLSYKVIVSEGHPQ